MTNKYGAVSCYSNLCKRGFDSKAERERGEQLHLMQRVGEINSLEYQPMFVLNEGPPRAERCVYTADFSYQHGREWVEGFPVIVEDVKGKMTEAARIRIIWLKQLTGIEVQIIK